MRFPQFAPSKTRHLDVECALIFLVGFLWLYFLNPYALPSIFQDRDIMRATELAAGKLILFGPEATGGGHLPGSFYYLMLAIPLKLGLGWQGCLTLMGILSSLSVALMWRFVSANFNRQTGYLSLVCLLTTRYFYEGYISFWNPSYLNLFTVTVLVGLGTAFARDEDDGGRRGWLMACICLGLGMQIHMSISAFLLAAILLQTFSKQLGLKTLRRNIFVGGILVILALISPYLLWKFLRIYDISVGMDPPGFIGNKSTSTFGFFAELPFKIGQVMYPHRFLDRIDYALTTGISMVVPFLFVIYLSARLVRRNAEPAPPVPVAQRISRVWLVCWAVTVLPALLVFLYPGRTRYFVCYIFIQALFIATAFYRVVERKRYVTWPETYTCLLLIYIGDLFYRFIKNHVPVNWTNFAFLILCALAAQIALQFPRWRLRAATAGLMLLVPVSPFYKHVRDGVSKGKGMPAHQFAAMSKSIIEQTGWSYEEARNRVFFVNVHFQRTPELMYNQLHGDWLATAGRKLASIGGQLPAGFFVAFDKRKADVENRDEFIDWLKEQAVQSWIVKGLKKREIRLGDIELVGSGYLVPYFIDDLSKQPPYFHNVGISYTSEFSCLKERDRQNSSVEKLADGVSFAFNDCPDRAEHCDICFKLSRDESADGKYLRLVLTGDILARGSSWINPDWNQNIERPYLSVQCVPGGKIERVEMVSRIGFSNLSRFRKNMNRTVLAPLERSMKNPCDGPIHRVAVGYKSTQVLLERQLKTGSGRESHVQDF